MLTREKILDAALVVARAEGLGGLSQRKLAKELGVSAMATYRHFKDKDALVHALLDHVIDADALLAHRQDHLEEGLVAVFTGMRAMFVNEPVVAPLAGTPASLGPNGLRFLDGLMEWLHAQLDTQTATRVVHHALNYTLGASTIAAAAQSTGAVAVAKERFDELDASSFPTLIGAAPHLLGFVSDAMFEQGLRLIVQSLLAGNIDS